MAVSGQLTGVAEKNRPNRKKPLSPAGWQDYTPPQTQYARAEGPRPTERPTVGVATAAQG